MGDYIEVKVTGKLKELAKLNIDGEFLARYYQTLHRNQQQNALALILGYERERATSIHWIRKMQGQIMDARRVEHYKIFGKRKRLKGAEISGWMAALCAMFNVSQKDLEPENVVKRFKEFKKRR